MYKNASILEHDSGGILVCMQIAYLSAIMKYSEHDINFKHPGFIMLDTIGKYLGTSLQESQEEYTEDMIMDPQTYEEIYKLFIELSKKYQIFIVDNIPHISARPYVKYTLYHDNLRGLINMSKNEKVKESMLGT